MIAIKARIMAGKRTLRSNLDPVSSLLVAGKWFPGNGSATSNLPVHGALNQWVGRNIQFGTLAWLLVAAN